MGPVLQHVQVGSIDFHGQRALEARKSLIDSIFRRLGVIEDNSGIRLQMLLNILGQLGLVVNCPRLPDGISVGPQSYIKLIIEKTRGIGSVIGTAQLRPDIRNHGILEEHRANWGESLLASSNEMV